MRSVRTTVGLAVAVLLFGVASAHAQSGAEDAINSRTDPKARKSREAPVSVQAPVKVERSARAATPATPATRAVPAASGGAATPAVPATPATPSGLSGDAPDTAPTVGVVGRGHAKRGGGPSPAATPEPSTLLLMGAGLAGLYGLRRRK
jgi:hypothetical protein